MILKQSFLAAALCLCAAGQAQAGFYVNDDAPVITAAHPDAARKNKTVFASFTSQRLVPASRAELVSTLDSLPAVDGITIITFARSGKQLAAANRRVSSVKAVLIRQGISPSKIVASAEIDPEADPLDTAVQVTFRTSTQRPSLDAIRSARFVQPLPSQPVPAPAPASAYQYLPAATPAQVGAAAGALSGAGSQQGQTAKLEFVKKIMAMASSKLISQESAIKLVNEYLANMAPVAGQTPTQPTQEAMPAMANAPQIVPFGEVPRVWTLAANKSLRDNIRDWAVAAGYGEPAWTASNLYQVTYTSTFTGTFLEVLHQVANAVPSLDFRVSRAARRLDVVDHSAT